MAKSNPISFRFNTETICLLKKIAANDKRSVANTIESLIHTEAKKLKIKCSVKEITEENN